MLQVAGKPRSRRQRECASQIQAHRKVQQECLAECQHSFTSSANGSLETLREPYAEQLSVIPRELDP